MNFHHWFLIIVGSWLIVSPWLLGFSELNLPLWNNIIIGVGLIIFALWNKLAKDN